MKKTSLIVALALGAGVLLACELGADRAVVAAASAQEAKGCSLIGSWATLPDAPIPWLCTMEGASAASGTIVCDVPRWPAPIDLGGLAPTAVRNTTLRGVWQRTGGSTFAFTQVGWAVDATGTPVYGARNSGTSTLSEDCGRNVVHSTMELFAPDLGPIDADPVTPGVQPFPPGDIGEMIGHRIEVTPPAAL